jgi:hypothetical protein
MGTGICSKFSCEDDRLFTDHLLEAPPPILITKKAPKEAKIAIKTDPLDRYRPHTETIIRI